MKLPFWISEYSPLSSADGEIDSMIIILPPEDQEHKLRVYQPLLKGLNSTRREVIKFHNDFSQINEFWRDTPAPYCEPEKDSFSKDIQSSQVGTPQKGKAGQEELNWEETTRSWIPDDNPTESQDSSSLYKASIDDWEENTRYFTTSKPTFKPEELVSNWQKELEKVKRVEDSISKTEGENYRRWVQDPVFCLQKHTGQILETTLLYSIFQQRMVDFILPLELSQNSELNLRCHPTKLIIEGGNILFIDKVLFIGKELIVKNIELLNRRGGGSDNEWNEKKVLEYFQQQFNVNSVVCLGSENPHTSFDIDGRTHDGFLKHRQSYQPFFHLDLYLNFGGVDPVSGKRIAFLGNPELAMKILNEERIDPETKETQSPLKHPHQGKELIETKMQVEVLVSQTKHFFIDLKEQLEEAGLTVVEIPLYFFAEPINNVYAACSWNNSLVEIYNRGQEKHIYLPTYQTRDRRCLTGHNKRLELLEKEVKEIYEKHGFNVHVIDAGRLFRNACQMGGSLHCMVKVLRRKYS